jgi:transposase
MRGRVDAQGEVFHTFNLEEMIPASHPLRAIKKRVDAILKEMSPIFGRAYAKTGRPSIPPERLVKALLLQALYSIRSEIQLCEQIGYNLLFRWFLDLTPSHAVWTPEVFSMNRERFDRYGFLRKFFDRVVAEAVLEGLVSEDHFSVDGTLIQSYASQKSLRPKGTQQVNVSDGSEDQDPGNPTINFRGQKRSNQTHRSLTDPQAQLARKGPGQPAMLSHSLHVLMENRNGLCLDVAVDEANPAAERRQALDMLENTLSRHDLWPRTLGADGNYKAGAFLAALEEVGIWAHVPMPAGPIRGQDGPARARRRARRRQGTKGYSLSQRIRKRVEEIFAWCKTVAGLVRARFVGRWKIRQQGEVTAAAYNLLRMSRMVVAG